METSRTTPSDPAAISGQGHSPWLRGPGIGRLGLLVLLVASAWWTWWAFRPAPRLDTVEFERLTSLGRFGDADRLVRDHLDGVPDDPRANYLRAQLLLERPDQAHRALSKEEINAVSEHLNRLERADPAGRVVPLALQALYRGNALYQQKRWEEAERSWLAALGHDSRVPEAGWSLLDLYYLEDRRGDARRLALKLFETEPDRRDAAQLLLELVRQDAIRPEPASLVLQFEPVVAAEPGGVRTTIALGQALIRSSQAERGLAILESLHTALPENAEVWEGWLAGLELASQLDRLAEEVDRLPVELARRPEFARAVGLAAQHRGDWAAAARAYERAVAHDPSEFGTLVRLERALRFAREEAAAEACAARIARHREALGQVLGLYDEADAVRTLGVEPQMALCERLAALREAMGLHDEAAAWRRVGPGSLKRPPPGAGAR